MLNRILTAGFARFTTIGLAALATIAVVPESGAFAQEYGPTRGRRITVADPAIVNRTDLLRRMARLEHELQALKPVRRHGHGHGHVLDSKPGVGKQPSGLRSDSAAREGLRHGNDVRRDGRLEIEHRGPVRYERPELDVRQLERALKSLEMLRRTVERAPSYDPEPLPCAMAAGPFARLVHRVRRTSFSSEKAALICEVAEDAYFTSEQAYALVALIPFSDDQVNAAVALYDRVLDREEFHRVYDALKFRSSRVELRRRLARKR